LATEIKNIIFISIIFYQILDGNFTSIVQAVLEQLLK
jgi:hypothetical protein